MAGAVIHIRNDRYRVVGGYVKGFWPNTGQAIISIWADGWRFWRIVFYIFVSQINNYPGGDIGS